MMVIDTWVIDPIEWIEDDVVGLAYVFGSQHSLDNIIVSIELNKK